MLAAASGPFASGFFASAGCAASEARFELAKDIETAGMEVQVEAEDSVEVEIEITHFTLETLVKVWLGGGTVDDDIGVSAGLTTV